ncbi:MAG TPA: cytochrome C oxidase subunit IV family protein [Acidimicrobiales bacterium]|nr:cytochrome C oxidase subunit IV family protein [Acidimicrobiales bacterium]
MATTETGTPESAHTSAVDANLEGDQGHHPSDFTYFKVFLILFAITAVEVLLYYKSIPGVNINNTALGVLAIAKFVIVVGYFMHLKFDNRILRRLFAGGLGLALLVYIAYLLTLGIFVQPPPPQP